MSWEREDTERWLRDYPLPRTFMFRGVLVWPDKKLLKGYGQWLRTAGSYHVELRGLFALCHEFLAAVPEGAPMPDGTQLAAMIEAHVSRQGALPIETEEPSDNPTETQTEPTS